MTTTPSSGIASSWRRNNIVLLARLPGVWHMVGRSLVVAGQRAPGDIDARGEDQAVVAHL